MPKYVIERELPGAGMMTADQLKGAASKSCSVLRELGPQIQWLESYVTENKLFCIYQADNVELIQKHAQQGGFPCNSIREVRCIIGPSTAE